MKNYIVRNWFILSLPLVVLLAWLLPEAGASGGWLRTEITTKFAVALIFVLQGMGLPTSALRHGAKEWKLHLLVQSFTFLLFPILGIAFDALIGHRLPPDLRSGFLFLCVLPSTISTSVVLTTIAGGNTVGAIFNAALSNILGIFLTPLWVAFLMKSDAKSQSLGSILGEIFLYLVAPMFLGQIIRHFRQQAIDKRKKVISNVSSGLILFLVFAAFCNSVKARLWQNQSWQVIAEAVAGVIGIFIVAMTLTELLARALKLNREDRIAALFGAPKKTIASGIPLAKAIFGANAGLGLILLPIMFYHPLQLFVCGVMADHFARQKPKP